jgi:ATP-dependent Clp protease ATP-binding subunit ClpB
VALDPNRFTRKTTEAVQAATSLARGRNHTQVTPDHLLAALVGQAEGVVLPVLQRIGVAPKVVVDRVGVELDKLPRTSRSPPRRSGSSRAPTRSAPSSATTTSRPSTCCSP